MIIPNQSTTSGLVGMYAKCKLVGRSGHSRGRSTSDNRTNTQTLSSNPDWKRQTLIIKATNAYTELSDFMRIEFFASSTFNDHLLGAAFVPREDFHSTERVRTYDIRPIKNMPITNGGKLGTITVKTRRIEEETKSSDSMKMEEFLHLTTKTTVKENNVFNTQYFCECILAGNLDVHGKYAEQFLMSVKYDGLYFFENPEYYKLNADTTASKRKLSVLDDAEPIHETEEQIAALEKSFSEMTKSEKRTIQPSCTMIVELFENEVRSTVRYLK